MAGTNETPVLLHIDSETWKHGSQEAIDLEIALDSNTLSRSLEFGLKLLSPRPGRSTELVLVILGAINGQMCYTESYLHIRSHIVPTPVLRTSFHLDILPRILPVPILMGSRLKC